ncbi:hypothetical protein P879_09554 [Paragonimus westermani]|uniref:FZ domain-containing protein n=1 Tax=Paragonimus westermani TaxID=34504 RepID=A0A8T0DCU6_9TREM|nr:hypothetical protein P879_09554 [Paragonimus westermani]
MPYHRRHIYKQISNGAVYSHTRSPAWVPAYSDKNFVADQPSDTVLFNAASDPAEFSVSETSISLDPIGIDPGSYHADWHRMLSGLAGRRCFPIPRNMSLCQRVGYDRMILPNYLQHEELKEAVDQSQVWVSLVHTECHPDLRKFLCALYAPVCVDEFQERLIHPCSDLCEDVRQSCLPKMLQFGFGWPEIVKCSRFPVSSTKMCIPLTDKMFCVGTTLLQCEHYSQRKHFSTGVIPKVVLSFCSALVLWGATIRVRAGIGIATFVLETTGLLTTLPL